VAATAKSIEAFAAEVDKATALLEGAAPARAAAK